MINLNQMFNCFFFFQLKPLCLEEVKRVMHERAAYVDLHPEIELACMNNLAEFCSQKTKPGEEIACLQDNLDM